MKFRARIANVELFQSLVATVEKIGKNCVILLSAKKIQLIVLTETSDGLQVWSAMSTPALFEDMVIESVNNNEISFETNVENLQRALKSGATGQTVTMKLTKKNNAPYLSVTVEIQTNQVMTITQDVPITLMSAATFATLSEPALPDPAVHICMPPLKQVRLVVERMRNVSEYLTVRANMAGEFQLKVDTDMVHVTTFWKHLTHPTIEGRSPPPRDEGLFAELRVDVKKFGRFLYSSQVQPNNVICCMIEGRALVLHVLLEDLYMTYYIPVIASGL